MERQAEADKRAGQFVGDGTLNGLLEGLADLKRKRYVTLKDYLRESSGVRHQARNLPSPPIGV